MSKTYWQEKSKFDNYNDEYYEEEFPTQDTENYRREKAFSIKSFIKFLISCLIMFFVAKYAMTFSFISVFRSVFAPSPYKRIKYEFKYPNVEYLFNDRFLDEYFFKFPQQKKQKMDNLKEGVDMPVLKSGLLNLLENYPELKPAIYVWDYETQNYVDIRADEIYPTASIIKIPVLIDVFKSIEYGQFSLDDKMFLTEYFRTEGSGNLQFKAKDSIYTIDQLANVMITDSDNSATNMLIAKVGSMRDVNSMIRSWGLNRTEINTWLPDIYGTNYSTAKEIATMLYNIDYNEKFLTEYSRSKMLNYMGHVHNDRLLQSGIPKDAVLLHKTGDIASMLGDAGIVIAPNGTKYIVVMLVKRPHNAYLAKEFIVNASKIIYDYMVR